MKKILLFLAFIVLVFSSNFSQTAAPRIIKTVPEFGDCNVDTSLKVIQIEFDQDMSDACSFPDCSNMIPIVGDPAWKTKRIIEVPVKLAPNAFYQAYLNSSDFRNFSNEDGIPLNPDYFLFRTRNYTDSSLIDTSLNTTNFEKFRDYFLKHYSHKDLYGINWEHELNSIKEDIKTAQSNSEFGFKLLKVLKKANDIHLSVDINNQNFSCSDFRLVPVSYNFGDVFSQIKDLQISGNNVGFTGKVGNAGYVLISSLNPWFAQDVLFTVEKLKLMTDIPYLILDLRLNRGGEELLAQYFVSMILSDTIAYERDALYNESTGQFDNILIKNIFPDNGSIKYKGKIFVLIGGNVASSAESFVLMLKQMPNVQLVGSKTYGASGNPIPFMVTDSVNVNIPSWLAYDMDGKLIENNGIQPDMKVEFPEGDYVEKDLLFNYLLDTIGHLPFLSVSTKAITISSSTSSSASFEISSNVHWTLTSDQPWLTIQGNSDSGNDTITVTATTNYNSSWRTATITVTGIGVPDKIIYITQNGAPPVLKLSKNTLTFEALANSRDTFNIVSNINWKVKCNQPWLTLNMTSGSDSAAIIATASANNTGMQRTAIITVSGTLVTPEYISIKQDAFTATGINEISSNADIRVYPNPTTGLLEISGIKHFEGEISIEVSNYLGSVVLRRNLKYVPAVQIDLSDYPSGVYLINIYSGDKIYQSKVIKKSN